MTVLLGQGIAAGESASALNADFRIYALPPKRVNRLRILSRLADETRTTVVPRPFAHATPPAALHPGPGDGLEWFTFSAVQHRRVRLSGDPRMRIEAWKTLAHLDPPIRSRIGTRLALTNLRNGAEPPQSGHDNAHYFDDIAMIRSLAAVGEYADDADAAIEAAVADAEITHSLDGLWCARATARLFSALRDGAAPLDAALLAAETLPEGTWSRRVAEASLAVAGGTQGALERARRLSVEVGDWIYSYPIAAPETLGFLLAHVSVASTPDDLLLGALAQPRNGASLPALAGAAAAIIFGTEWMPSAVREPMLLTGLCIPEFAGRAVQELLS
ncbi:ADP-ribosylglycohydrolase family protein [Leifsonia shinshuensis]|uniref:ADP-ribosylglycohydrolase family protein n=1 Tax=Leifsonia shinshuensis TaxID=150026 RepID=UPI001F509CE6|nr:ADP-ribosylglycohydrolase family protein [Leifsonia shinshuensis]MCI0157096.1 ADP-ribosylglycohydrolase family protein [Leifsonia shinshuensis]